MSDVWTILAGAASGPAALGLVKLAEKIAARRHRAEQSEAERAHEAHDECRREVEAVRSRLDDQSREVSTLRASVVQCESKHESATREVSTLRGVCDVLMHRIARLERNSDPPRMEPAE